MYTSYFLCSLFLYYQLIRVSESNINTPYSKNRRSILENRTRTQERVCSLTRVSSKLDERLNRTHKGENVLVHV